MKRIIALILSMVLMGTALVGCGNAKKEDDTSKAQAQSSGDQAKADKSTEDETVNIKLVHWDINSATYVQPALDAYKELHPNVNVEVIDIPANEYDDKLSVMLAGGDDSDVIAVKDIASYSSMISKEQIDPLNDYIDKDKIDLAQYNGETDEITTDDGNLYAMPFRSDFWIMYYNKDIFDAAGVPYPSNDITWDEYEQLAKKVTSGSGADKIYGSIHHIWNSTVQLATVQDGKNTLISEDYSFMKPMYERILRMQDEGTIMDYASLKAGNIHYSGPFFNGQVAMLPMGTWFIGTLMTKTKSGEANVNWGMVKFPHPEGVEAGTTAGTTTTLAINSNSKHKDAAWDFIKFLSGPEGAKVLADVGTIPAIVNDDVLTSISGMDGFPEDENSVKALETTKVRLEMPMNEKGGVVGQILGEEHELIMTESVSVDDGLAELSRRVKEALAQ